MASATKETKKKTKDIEWKPIDSKELFKDSSEEEKNSEKKAPLKHKFFEKGETIFKEGDEGEVAYIINNGMVDIIKETKDKKFKLATLKSDGIFGEMAVIDGSKRMASAVASENCVLTIVPKSIFDSKLNKTDLFIKGVLNIVINNLRNVQIQTLNNNRNMQEVLDAVSKHSQNMKTYIKDLDDNDETDELMEALLVLEKAALNVKELSSKIKADKKNKIN